jgi:hypothetical protein
LAEPPAAPTSKGTDQINRQYHCAAIGHTTGHHSTVVRPFVFVGRKFASACGLIFKLRGRLVARRTKAAGSGAASVSKLRGGRFTTSDLEAAVRRTLQGWFTTPSEGRLQRAAKPRAAVKLHQHERHH